LWQALSKTAHGDYIGCLSQELQLAQELLSLLHRLTVTNDGNHYGTLTQILLLLALRSYDFFGFSHPNR
jgi:hypothetical protein